MLCNCFKPRNQLHKPAKVANKGTTKHVLLIYVCCSVRRTRVTKRYGYNTFLLCSSPHLTSYKPTANTMTDTTELTVIINVRFVFIFKLARITKMAQENATFTTSAFSALCPQPARYRPPRNLKKDTRYITLLPTVFLFIALKPQD